jgi:DNA-binding transcriptional ArsR family regulator
MTPEPPEGWRPDPQRDIVLNATVLRALSHPMRNQLLGLLRRFGPSTATGLAGRLGVNSRATSYHLRQLAEAGLIVEDEGHASGRERWWRSAHRGTYLDQDLFEEEPELANAYLRGNAQVYAEAMLRYSDEIPSRPKAWQRAADMSDFAFHLTPSQLTQMLDEIMVILGKYRTEEEGPHTRGSRPVTVQLQAFPREGR